MKQKLYLHCRFADKKSVEIAGCPNVGIEHLGNCYGEAVLESGEVVNRHHSSTLDFLRSDLLRGIYSDDYEVVDLIDEDVKGMGVIR